MVSPCFLYARTRCSTRQRREMVVLKGDILQIPQEGAKGTSYANCGSGDPPQVRRHARTVSVCVYMCVCVSVCLSFCLLVLNETLSSRRSATTCLGGVHTPP